MYNVIKSKAFRRSVTTAITLIIAYAITWRFCATLWVIILFIDLVAFLCYFTVFLESIVFWIRNRKKFSHPFVPFCIGIVPILIFFVSPSTSRNKSYHLQTVNLCERHKSNCPCNLYFDFYKIYKGGTGETDVGAVYLTDLKTFRKYIGTYDAGDEQIDIKCNGDNIITTKTSNEGLNLQWTSPKVIERKKFSLKDLKKQQAFE